METTKYDEASTFKQRAEHNLKNIPQKFVAGLVQDFFKMRRAGVYSDLDNKEDLQKLASEIKKETIANLDGYLDLFTSNIQKNGGKVYFASDDNAAVDYICNLVEEKGVKSIVKSKSMVTEEIALNKHLAKTAAEVFETDLGEFIVQLAKEKPFHIVGPAIHKNIEQIAEIFSNLAGYDIPPDASELATFAREFLRDKFFNADMGITGCNFGVCESGSTVLVSNEGNGRLTTTLPKIHVVVMGMERLVPTWEDLDVMLTLLTRSAIGQKTISYVTAISGPKQLAELDGPEELHVVIVDNGRSNMLGSDYQETLNCIRCGCCLNVCPIFRHIGGHAYGTVYNGPIGSILTTLMSNMKEGNDLSFACTLCGACTEACPVNIPLHDYLLRLRKDIVAVDSEWKKPMLFKTYSYALSSPTLYKTGQRFIKRTLTSDSDYIKESKTIPEEWLKYKYFPKPTKQTFQEWWKQQQRGKQ